MSPNPRGRLGTTAAQPRGKGADRNGVATQIPGLRWKRHHRADERAENTGGDKGSIESETGTSTWRHSQGPQAVPASGGPGVPLPSTPE